MRLLLAEDERELARALTAILNHGGYSVDTVYDGQDALDYLLVGEYDGAVLDIMMPKLDGIEVVSRVRKTGKRLPILMLTAKSEIDDRVRGLDSGADDYLTKPFAAKELLARLRAITRRNMEAPATSLTIGRLTLDRASCELSTPDGSIRLANREFQMMELLMSNAGHVISTERFMEKIWGCDSNAEQSVVWVYISNLRKKLASLNAGVQITVSRGLGYIIEEEK
ncbi:MAG: response regulator transcription factor [Clostridia bacterium]|nr:response regulator transcription factor [Clostridia bacterium]